MEAEHIQLVHLEIAEVQVVVAAQPLAVVVQEDQELPVKAIPAEAVIIQVLLLIPAEVEEELAALKAMGFEEVLLLTGERTSRAGFDYLLECVGGTVSGECLHIRGIGRQTREVERNAPDQRAAAGGWSVL